MLEPVESWYIWYSSSHSPCPGVPQVCPLPQECSPKKCPHKSLTRVSLQVEACLKSGLQESHLRLSWSPPSALRDSASIFGELGNCFAQWRYFLLAFAKWLTWSYFLQTQPQTPNFVTYFIYLYYFLQTLKNHTIKHVTQLPYLTYPPQFSPPNCCACTKL